LWREPRRRAAAKGIARGGGGSPPGKGRGAWGRGVASPIRARARAPRVEPGRRGSVDRRSQRRTGPGQALGWLAVGVELAKPRVLLYRNLGWFFVPGPCGCTHGLLNGDRTLTLGLQRKPEAQRSGPLRVPGPTRLSTITLPSYIENYTAPLEPGLSSHGLAHQGR
jgi:hypothetical protein